MGMIRRHGETLQAKSRDRICTIRERARDWSIADRRVETIASLNGQARAIGIVGPWLGAAPDGSPVVLLDAGTHDIYALDWEAP